MLDILKKRIDREEWEEARRLADELKAGGEHSDLFSILNAAIYQYEQDEENAFQCIRTGLTYNPSNYELYFMLGNYYLGRNIEQSYLCYQQALFYCREKEDRMVIEKSLRALEEIEELEVHPVSIVILSHNIQDIMIGCIESIRRNCPEGSYEMVVVDNASTDGITEWLKKQSDISLICNERNQSFAYGCNQGIKRASPDNDILLLNNDTIVPPNALFWLRMGLYERKTVGAVGPVTNCAGNHQQLNVEYQSVEEYLKLAGQINVPMKNAYENKVFLIGFAMLIRRKVIDEIGLLDTSFAYGGFEDNDYGMRVTKAGYELLLCMNSFIYHYGSLNMSKDMSKYQHYMEKNHQKLKDKWGFSVMSYSDIQTELIQKIQESPDAGFAVLEVGCGYGVTLSRIRAKYPNAQVYGIESSEKVAGFGRYMGNIISGNIEQMELPYEEGFFDYLILGNELEKMSSPGKVLLELKKYLNKSGKLLIKVYNLMNISIMIPLLQGEFSYIDGGILNEKHTHFYTCMEIKQLLKDCGYENIQISAFMGRENIRLRKEDEVFIEELYSLSWIADKNWFEAYQFLITAER